MKKVLTIAGSDCSGGAGIQADLKTISAHKNYAMSVITSLTAQNTTGVHGIYDISPEFVAKQLDCVFTDIRPDAIKIGMVSNNAIIEVVAKKLIEYKAENIVIDPVMVSTSGSKLLSDVAIGFLVKKLLPLGKIITPNIPEAEVLSRISINNKEDMMQAAEIINKKIKCAVLIKGGHSINNANDLLIDNGVLCWFESERIDNPNTHGTGCTLSSAIASNLASGCPLNISIMKAKEYISGALKAQLDLGKGSGPLNHLWNIHNINGTL